MTWVELCYLEYETDPEFMYFNTKEHGKSKRNLIKPTELVEVSDRDRVSISCVAVGVNRTGSTKIRGLTVE